MTFFYFLRGLWLRVFVPVRRFYVDTVRYGEPLLFLSDEDVARRKAEKKTVEGGALLSSGAHPSLRTAPVGKPDKPVFSYEIEHPFSVLCPDCRKATIDLLKRNQQAREQAITANS